MSIPDDVAKAYMESKGPRPWVPQEDTLLEQGGSIPEVARITGRAIADVQLRSYILENRRRGQTREDYAEGDVLRLLELAASALAGAKALATNLHREQNGGTETPPSVAN